MAEGERRIALSQREGFELEVHWDDMQAPLISDESPPLGRGVGPNPGQLLLAAVAACMTDSLVFALRKFGLDAGRLQTQARAQIGRNEAGRQRVLGIQVDLQLAQLPPEAAKLDRVLGQFEQFCTVGQSVAQGIPTLVRVLGPDGNVLTPLNPT